VSAIKEAAFVAETVKVRLSNLALLIEANGLLTHPIFAARWF
jgi:hypothetical protein